MSKGVQGDACQTRVTEMLPFRLFDEAHITECLEKIAGHTSGDMLLLRMRCLVRLGREGEIVSSAFRESVEAALPRSHQSLGQAILAFAYLSCKMREAARFSLQQSEETEPQLSEAFRPERLYWLALCLWIEAKDDEAAALATKLHGSPKWAARAYQIESWIAYRRDDPRAQLNFLLRALDHADDADLWFRAGVLMALSNMAAELSDRNATDRAIASLAKLPAWTQDTRSFEFGIHHNLGWCAMNDGRYFRALSRFHSAEGAAPTETKRALALIDGAYLAFACGQSRELFEMSFDATNLAFQVDWKGASEERDALLVLAQVWTPQHPGVARRLVDLYCNGEPFSEWLAIAKNDDVRRNAVEQFTAGLVYAEDNMYSRSVEAVEFARQSWDRLQYHWRYCLASAELSRITGNSTYLDGAFRRAADVLPNSWILQRVQARHDRSHHPDLRNLSLTEQRAIELLLEGLENDQIAQRLGVKPGTIRKRFSEIYGKFGCRSLQGLFHELIERKMI